MWETLANIPLLPGWTKEISTPTVQLGRTTKEVPVLSVGAFAAGAVEFIIDPFVAAAVIPRGFFTTTKLGRLAAKAQLDPATSVLTFPLRKAAAAVTSRMLPGFGPFLFHLRDPISAGLPGIVTDAMQFGGKALETAGDRWGRIMIGLVKKHRPRKGFLRQIGIGRREGLDEAALARVATKLFENPRLKVLPAEQALVDDMLQDVILPLHKEMQGMGYDRIRAQGIVRGRTAGPTDVFAASRQAGRTPKAGEVSIIWDPERDLLSKFHITPKGFQLRPSAIGEPPFSARMRTEVNWKVPGRKMPYEFRDLHTSNKDPFHALEMWVEQVQRQLILEERVRARGGGWALRGLVNRFRPSDPNRNEVLKRLKLTKGADAAAVREMAGDENTWKYFVNKMHDFTGHRAGKFELAVSNTMIAFVNGINSNIESAARKNRILRYVLKKTRGRTDAGGLPQMPKIETIAGVMTANTMIATLGFNLASAIKNTSQLVNTAAVKGLPATFKGMYKMADYWSEEGKTLRQLRKAANFNNTYRRLINEEAFVKFGRRTFDDIAMGPFNAVEMHMRGIAFNVAVGEEMKRRGIRKLKDLDDLLTPQGFRNASQRVRELMELGIREAHDTNFIYGIAGRSHFMMSPIARVAFALQSFSWKQAEFVSRAWRRDGSALLRLIGMNGWLIEMGDRFAGINAENWLGWGFLPPSQLGRGPAIEALTNLTRAMMAVGEDDDRSFERFTNSLRGNIREIFRSFGDPEDVVGIQAAIGAAALAGLRPLPVVGIGKTFKVINEFRTGIRESRGGKTWQSVTPDEVLKSWFFQTHRQAEDKRFREMDRRLKTQVNSVLARRTKAYMRAMSGTDGNEVLAAAKELALPVGIKVPITGVGVFGTGVLRAAGFRLGDDKSFWPHPEMVKQRLDNLALRRTVSKDVTDMIDAGWALEVYLSQYANRAYAELDRGAILGLTDPR